LGQVIDIMASIDNLDLRILSMLQKDGSLTQRDLAEGIGLSQNALWRRLQALQAAGVMRGSRVMVDLKALGLDLTVLVMIKTRHHSRDWLESFARHVGTLARGGRLLSDRGGVGLYAEGRDQGDGRV
jgi:Lrp/AsnC family transcriptional regulator